MNVELWNPDIEITNDFAQHLIEQQFAELAPVNIKYIGKGWDNKVFLVNEQCIFRFPHRDIAATLIERENAVLEHLQSIVSLKIPHPMYTGKPSDVYPYHFHGYPIIHGKSGCQALLTPEVREASITKLAEFLKKLHHINEEQARKIGAKEQVFDRIDVESSINTLSERVEKVNAREIASINLKIFEQEMQTVRAIKLPNVKVLVHGDLYSRHLIFDQDALVGIIDWGDVGINNPAVDLAVIFSFYPESCRKVFYNIYGNIDADTLAYARFLGLYSAITVMLYGHDIQDKQLMCEGRDSILRINSKLLT